MAAATRIHHDAPQPLPSLSLIDRKKAASEHSGLCGKSQAALAGISVGLIRADGKEPTAKKLHIQVSDTKGAG